MERPEATTPRIRGTTERVDAAARALRRRETPAERLLWDALRGRKVAGLKFRRQHPVGPFVLDFYCPDCKLVIEVDGGIHDGQDAQEQDTDRTSFLTAYGYRVLRIRNDEVLYDLPNVLKQIVDVAQADQTSARATLLDGGTPPLSGLGEGVGG